MNINGKSVFITGANRGIGKALAQEAIERGASHVYAGMRTLQETSDKRITPIRLDVTDRSQITEAVSRLNRLDILINNAGIAIYDDLSSADVIKTHLAVNLLGPYEMTRACLPLLKQSKGAVVNNLSIVAVAALPLIPSYSISKAASLNMTQSLRALLKSDSVTVHGVFLGPVDTDMNKGLDIPKDSPAAAAKGIFDGLERGEEDIFPDALSAQLAEGWRRGLAKQLETQNSAFLESLTAAK
ncbi:SDR family NAD(P)-dependent oxidoreductase [Occallatibacter riparius]|uniref:SDR family NAD(P)-dependent oxidoreductase n=1 Tax=Occallatibacter riparius TaxID=1002689 RepID=A0A9J7BRE3_9BACT|nr:SDR family NAD(P)-dependent oxidoreductase [Occallatibacter riparius]UWZ83494.1 SDR family NAD(P)-dependent oxidoreductase [Occallatibacter riparius]